MRTAAKERGKHQAKEFTQQLLLTPQASFDLSDQRLGEVQRLEGLLESLRSSLGLGLIASEALLGCAAAALSGFGLTLLSGCGTGHGIGLHKVKVVVTLRVWR